MYKVIHGYYIFNYLSDNMLMVLYHLHYQHKTLTWMPHCLSLLIIAWVTKCYNLFKYPKKMHYKDV